MRSLFLLPVFCLLSSAASAQSLETTMPNPILGNGQADAAQRMGGNVLDAPLTDGVMPSEKRKVIDQAIREAVARDEMAKQAAKEAAAKKALTDKDKKSGKKSAVPNASLPNAPLTPAGQGQASPLNMPAASPAPMPVSNDSNAEDQILQQMR